MNVRIVKDGIDVIRQGLRIYAGKHPPLFYNLYGFCGLRHDFCVRSVSPETELVIEGFPRSANTFAVVAFVQAQRQGVRIAHHLHAPAQVIRAAHWQIPTLVLIREPKNTILSQVIRKPQSSIAQALSSYISFYEAIIEYRDAYVVGTFQEVTKEYGTVIEKVNAKFGTHFFPFDHTDTNLREVFTTIETLNVLHGEGVEDQVSRPSVGKEKSKYELENALQAKKVRALLSVAEAIYRDFSLSG